MDKLLRSNKSTEINDLGPLTIAELNERIDKSMDDFNKDRLITSREVAAEIEKWG